MKTIWKYCVQVEDRFEVQMPKGAEVITVQMQGDVPCIWALVDPAQEMEPRRFRLAGTGHSLPDNINLFGYLGTFQPGALVFHLFEILPEVTVRAATDLGGRLNIAKAEGGGA